jgi:hypothetical protein
MGQGKVHSLLGVIGATALLSLLAVVALTSYRTGRALPALLQDDFFFGDYGNQKDGGMVGRVQQLASAEASQGKASGGVKTLLKNMLNKQVHDREAHRYTNALKMGGLDVDPAAEKTIMMAFRKSKRGASSLAIDNKLQKQVVLAGAIKGRVSHMHEAHQSPRVQRHSLEQSDKLALAEAILSGRSGPTGGSILPRHKPGVKAPAAKHAAIKKKKHAAIKKKKVTFKKQMIAALKKRTAALEKQARKPYVNKATEHQHVPDVALKGNFAKAMLANLDQKEKHMARAAWHSSAAWHSQVKAVTSQDLATASWRSAKEAESKGMGVDTTLDDKSSHKAALTVGASSDSDQISLSSGVGAAKSREQLEAIMKRELNTKASSIERREFYKIAKASMPKTAKHLETDLVKKEAAQEAAGSSRHRLENALEKSVKQIDQSRVEALYHAGLVKEKFDGAVVSKVP